MNVLHLFIYLGHCFTVFYTSQFRDFACLLLNLLLSIQDFLQVCKYIHTHIHVFLLLYIALCPMTLLSSSSSCSLVFLRVFHVKKKKMFPANNDSFTCSFPIIMLFSFFMTPFRTINTKSNRSVMGVDLFSGLRWGHPLFHHCL